MLNQIRYFQAIVETGSFTEAAEQCYISQSAISQQIQSLERELGIKLINRQKRSITITPAGEYFYKKSKQLVHNLEKICQETVDIANQEKPRLRIGCLRGLNSNNVTSAIESYISRNSEVSVDVIYGNHDELYDYLRFGGLDVVINDQRRAFSNEYHNEILFTTGFYIEMSSRNPLSSQQTVDIKELEDTPFIIVAPKSQRDNESKYYSTIVGFNGDYIFADDMEQARMKVTMGKGVLPVEGDSVHLSEWSSFARIPLCRNGELISKNYCAFWKKENKNKEIDAFVDILESRYVK